MLGHMQIKKGKTCRELGENCEELYDRIIELLCRWGKDSIGSPANVIKKDLKHIETA